MERQDDDRKLSFSYDVCGEKLGLIDVSQEDDFLIDSPLFDSLEDLRLSAFDGSNEDEAIRLFRTLRYEAGNTTEETILQKEQNLSSSGSMEPARPSYLRKSLAWDSAFFNSAGILDPDELAFLNRGLKAVEDIRMGRAETKSSVHRSRKINIGRRSEIKSKAAFQGHNTQRSVKTKMKHDSQREEPSLKHPKASERIKDLPRGQSMRTSLNKCDVEIEDATKLGKMHRKKSALLNSYSLPSGCLSSAHTIPLDFSISSRENVITLSPYKTSLSGSSRKVPSALVRGKTESRKGKLCAITSPYGTPARLLKGNKKLEYCRTLILSRSIPNSVTCMSPGSSFSDIRSPNPTPKSKRKQQADELEPHLDTSVVQGAGLQCDVLLGPNTPHISQRKSSLSFQCEEMKPTAEMNIETIAGTSPISTEPRKKFKPSGLRQPSPNLGFFDEEKAVFAKTNGGLQFQHEIVSTLPKAYGPIDRKRPAKPFQDNTSPGTKTLKHSLGSHILQSAPGIKGRNPSSDKMLWDSSPRVKSTMKSWSDVASRLHTRKCVGIEEGTCYKSRKVDARECDRGRVGQNSILKGEDNRKQFQRRVKKRLGLENAAQRDNTRNHKMGKKNASSQVFSDDLHLLNDEDKTRISFNWEDQVIDLSRCFDIIDLNKDILLEFKDSKDPAASSQNGDSGNEKNTHSTTKSPFFDRKNILDDHHQGLPNIFPNSNQPSLLLSDSLPSSRTPLADKTSVCNQNGSFKSPGESTKVTVTSKEPVCSFEGIDKENI